MRFIRIFHFVLISLISSVQCNAIKSNGHFVWIRIEYLGETDKAPPVVSIGIKAPQVIKENERFYLVPQIYLSSQNKSCISGLKSEVNNSYLIKITLNNGTDEVIVNLNDKKRIISILDCIKNLSKKYNYRILEADILRIQNNL